MKHRFSTAVRAWARVALPIGLLACTDRVDPTALERNTPPAPAAGSAARASLAVQDALTRLIPNLSHADRAAGLEQSFRELATALASANDAATASAFERARVALDSYGRASNADAEDVDAIRLAIDVQTETNTLASN